MLFVAVVIYAIFVVGLTRAMAQHEFIVTRGDRVSFRTWVAFAITAAAIPVLVAPITVCGIAYVAWRGFS